MGLTQALNRLNVTITDIYGKLMSGATVNGAWSGVVSGDRYGYDEFARASEVHLAQHQIARHLHL